MRRILTGFAFALALAGCAGAPASVTAQAPVSGPAVPVSSVQTQINAIRGQAGLAGVSRNAMLDAAALRHAKDMAVNNFMGHTGSDGSDLRKRVERTGYGWCTLAENVSKGYATDARALEGWRASSGHYANLVKRNVKDFGMADVNGFHVMVLAARRC
jgi:uncharacterized protein YkwD